MLRSTAPIPAGGNPYGTFLSAERLYYAGNLADNHSDVRNLASHNARFPYLGMAVIAGNTLMRPRGTAHNLKLHAPVWGSGTAAAQGIGGGYSRWIQIAENEFVGGTNAWPVAIAPQSDNVRERVRDIIFERNWNTFSSTNQVGVILLGVTDGGVRDNIAHAPTARYVTGTKVGRRGTAELADPSSGVEVRHNVVIAGTVSKDNYKAVVVEENSSATVGDNLAVLSACELKAAPGWVAPLWSAYLLAYPDAKCPTG